jgi:uncharacterized protein DUF6114
VPSSARGNHDSCGLTPAEVPAPAGRVSRAWQAWRQWRHTRPFWGGFLVIVGGTEILISEKGPLPLIVHIGFQGLAGYLIPAVMVLCGLLLLFHPVQQTFYSLLAVLLALGSWITSNLGGFFIGMLLGVIGGALAFAWQRGQPGPEKLRRRPRPQREPSAGLALIREEAPDGADVGPAPEHRPGPGEGMGSAPGEGTGGGTAMLALPLVPLALSVLLGPVPHGQAPAPLPMARATTTVSGSAISQKPLPTTSASPSVTPTPITSSTATPSPPATPTPSPSPSPSTVHPPGPGHKHARHVTVTGPPAVRASAALSLLTAGSAVLTGLSFDGVSRVPTAAGRVPMLKFSMASMTFSGGTRLLVTQAGHTSLAKEPSLGFSGDVVLYTTKISGELNGIRVTFTPKKPPSRLRRDVTIADVAAHQPYATARSAQASGLLITR